MSETRVKICTLYAYRTDVGVWGPYVGTIVTESAYDYCAGIVDIIGRNGGYAELFQIDRYESGTTGRNRTDVYTTVRMYGERPAKFEDLETRETPHP